MGKKGATQSKSGSNRSAKDSATAAMMKRKGIMRSGSDATLNAVESRMNRAIPAGSTPPGGWFDRNKPED